MQKDHYLQIDLLKALAIISVILIHMGPFDTPGIIEYLSHYFTQYALPVKTANVIFTFVAIYTVERLGRRILMLLGAGGLAGIYLILGTCYFFEVSGFFMVVLVVLAIACYAMSLGPITWVLLAEIFPNRVRAVAMATCTFALWVGSFTLTYTFPLLNNFLGSSGTFWIYAAICAVGYLFFFRALPETKGKSLEALEKDLIK